MADEKDKPDPIVQMFAVDDERAREATPQADEVKVDPPEDKKQQERDDAGKFKGKEGDEKLDAKADEKRPEEKKPDAKAPEEKPKDVVPLATFLEKTNKLKEQLDAKDITLKQFQDRIAALEARLPKDEPKSAPEPDFVEDPKGYVDHKLKSALDGIAEANKKAETEGKKAQETAAAASEQVQIQTFMTNLQQHEQRFVQANPDYHDALTHIRTVRAAQLREFSPEITDQQIVDTIRHEERTLAIQLARQGRDPVQTAYNLAKHYGYQKKAPADPPAGDAPKLPDVPNKRLPPDQTLGTGSGEVEREAYKAGETDPVDLALASVFKKSA